ncbi:hypothetical protein DSCO28_49700 [Desulfosarcina ovata subsp. sediminis]|uniref:histidine kinase n=1 Tax=Desulfosarcina ovata subsp. sediminis TaxID=885957 RepID=A0A5K7ZW46_9BACT|nr:ATP-binding protein [Desulfosarcina ovata]BBO84404.1 hypothetical protein DSCO28_49700 [Desulfosarcina ovata subsp. sediminis]
METTANNIQRLKYYLILVIFCGLYWFGDSLWSYISFERNLKTLIFIEPSSLLDTLMLRVSPYQVVSRIIVVSLFAVAGTVLFEVMVTKQRAETAYRNSEAKYRALVNHASEAIFIVQEGRLKYVNPKASELVGITEKHLLDEPIDRFIHPSDQAFMHWYTEQQKNVSASRMCTFRMVNEKSDIIWVRLNTTPIEWERKFATLNFLSDISEEKRLADQLQRAEKMETVGMLAGGVAHDLNNILSGLVSYPDLLLMDLPEDSPLRKPILTMQKSGQKAALIVQDLLTLARRSVPRMEVVSLNTIVQDYLASPEFSKLQSFHPKVSIQSSLAPDLLNIQGASVHLSKTVMNLISNAAEACHQENTITISTSNQYVDRPIGGYEAVKEGDYVLLKVQDTGEGISPKDIQRIFEPFYSKKVMGHSGTGLGMAVVWGTVKDHHGYIDLKSNLGKGTEVSIYFPVTRETAVETIEPSILELKGNGQRILIVDDVEEQRSIASSILTKLGYQPYVVSSGEEAISHLKTTSADLVILDMIMDPGMDGLDTYKEILKLHPGQKTVIASGFAETDRVKEMQRMGAGPYLCKPYTLVTIGNVIKSALAD